MQKHYAFERACKLTGGQANMAKLLNVKPPTVSQWVHLVKQIPAERCPEIEKAVNGAVTCEELRPDVDWAYLRSSAPKAEAAGIVIHETIHESSGKVVNIDSTNRREDERRHSERRNGDRRNNSNGGGRRSGERRVNERRVVDRRE